MRGDREWNWVGGTALRFRRWAAFYLRLHTQHKRVLLPFIRCQKQHRNKIPSQEGPDNSCPEWLLFGRSRSCGGAQGGRVEGSWDHPTPSARAAIPHGPSPAPGAIERQTHTWIALSSSPGHWVLPSPRSRLVRAAPHKEQASREPFCVLWWARATTDHPLAATPGHLGRRQWEGGMGQKTQELRPLNLCTHPAHSHHHCLRH